MKNLLTIFILFLGLGLVNAQEKKPTKEETINFIERILNTSHNMNGPVSEFKINDNTLLYRVFDDSFLDQKVEYYGIYFEKINSVTIDPINYSNNNTRIKINFDYNGIRKSVKTKWFIEGLEDANHSEDNLNIISLAVPKIKAESIIKAFERLKEIAKEENKDPFAE